MLPAEGRQGEDPSPPPLPGTAKAPRPAAAAPSPEPMVTTPSTGAASSSSSWPPAPSSASPSSASPSSSSASPPSASPPSASHPDAVRILAADVSPLGHSPPPSPPGPGRAAAASAAEIFAESGAEAEIEIEFEAESEFQIEVEAESESEIEFEAEREFQIEFEAESESEFEAESESEGAAASASFRSPAFSPAKVQKGPAEPRGEDDSPITKATRIGRSGGAGGGGSSGAVPGPASSDLDPGRGLSVPEDAEQDGHDGAEAGGDTPGEAGGPPDLSAIAHAVLRTAGPGGGGPESEGGVEGEGEDEGEGDDADGGSSRGGISHLSGIGLMPLSRDHSVHSLVLSADYVATQEAGFSALDGLGLEVSLLRGAPEAPGGDGGDADLELGGGGGADEDADADGWNAGQPMGASFLGPDLNRRSTSPGRPMLPGGGTGDVDRESPQKLDSSFAGLQRKVKDRLEPLCSHVPMRAVLVLVLTLLLVVLGLYGIYDAMVKDATQFRSPSDDLFDPDPVPVSDPVPAADQGS